jgi:DNA-directed RNA polymerase subunit RPC12/RpoP
MEHSRSILKLETTTQTENQTDQQQTNINYMCIRCGKQFTKPIFAVNNSPGVAEAYYACPTCLSKIEIKKEDKNPKPSQTAEQQTLPETNPVTPIVCHHHMGYLKKRPKNTSVPEECLTCPAMLDCMAH